jgi:quercetin dioxygenase-like cupin family protein
VDARDSSKSAGAVLTAPNFAETLDYFSSLGFRVEEIFPADSPRRATLIGFGCRLFLEEGPRCSSTVRIRSNDAEIHRVVAPNGTIVEFLPDEVGFDRPALQSSLVVTPSSDGWHQGRAGMFYRDLVPGRQGNCVIASHIRIPTGGPVPDYVHFHEVGFQLIFCHRGWVEVVYEGQGEPFVLEAGDCVIQPPRIRHRVLRSSDEMHVVEIGYPAEHVTKADPTTTLPSSDLPSDHEWSGQRFIRFRSAQAKWSTDGQVEIADTGVASATSAAADVHVVRGMSSARWATSSTPIDCFRMIFVLEGRVTIDIDGHRIDAEESTTLTIPVGRAADLEFTRDSRLLVVDVVTN